MKKMLLIVLLITGLTISAEKVNVPENLHKELFDCVSSYSERTEIEFSLDGYQLENISENSINYQKISYFNAGEFLEIGKPDLPRFSKLVAIPNQGEVEVTILNFEEEIIRNINIYPRQRLQSESQPNDRSFIIDNDFYTNGEIFPGKIAELGEPAIMRDFRVVNLTINPFQFDPVKKELRIIKNIDLEITSSGNGGENIKSIIHPKSRFFQPLYESTVVNFNYLITRDEEYQQPCYLFIYPDNASVLQTLDYLTEWKHQKGFEVIAASTAETGTELNQIKNYIQDAYDNWQNPPEFVCLVGDAGGNFSIPTGHIDPGEYNGEGDQYYTLLEGDDILADVLIGRLSFNSLIEFQTIVSKILNYEKNPYLDNIEWYDKALMVGDPNESGPSCVDTKVFIKEMIDEHAPNIECEEVYSGNWVYHISNNLNSGVSYFNYRGFVEMSGWDNYDTENLTNGYMLPFVAHPTCFTGDFEGTYDCRSEAFLKAGSPAVPKGAIAAFGTATGYTHTCFNNCIDAGAFYGIFAEGIYQVGGALNRGKINLVLNYPGNPNNWVYRFSYWNNLMGDPGMELWTGVPQELDVIYPGEVALGTNLLEVTVLDNEGIPIENAWVSVLLGDDEIFSTAFTDEQGVVILPLNYDSEGEAVLTVTKHNFIPHLGSFEILQGDTFVNVLEIEIDDDNSGTSSGNNDGNINPGENIELRVNLQNYGTLTANNVSAAISSENEFITITDDTEDYGNIESGSSSFSADDFDISVQPDVLGGTEIEIDMQITDNSENEWYDIIYLNIEGANLDVSSFTVFDENNNILDPGETAEISLTVSNLGSVDANDIYGTISCSHPDITISDADGYFGNIEVGEEISNNENRFEISANTTIYPGTQINFEIQLYNADGYDNVSAFIFEVGEVLVTDPLGPDAYGYYCFDDGDAGYYNTPEYQWIEIDPDYGGQGTIIQLDDQGNEGDTEVLDLPLNFRFYGQNYSEITVCSNGWLSPGITDNNSFMNWNIPGALGPSPLIAPFWDDLITGDGNVCYFYNDVYHYFVIEWSRLYNEYNSNEETFQVVLYDADYYPTMLGDSEIKFQYHTVSNVDQGGYFGFIVNHGLYATVGIEDPSGTIGLEYTFNNEYPTAAKVLENESAIFFTGPPISIEEPYLVLGTIEISGGNGNGNVDHGETVNLHIPLNNLGENPATGVSAIISLNDEYTTLLANSSAYNDIPGEDSEINLDDFSISVDETCPDGHLIFFQMDVQSNENNWTLYFGLEVHAPDIIFQQLSIFDGNNNILDPGETGELWVNFSNNGGADASTTLCSISTDDDYLTINSNDFDFGTFPAGEQETAVFYVTVGEDAPIGHEVVINWEITADLSYAISGNFSNFLVQSPVNLVENFNNFPPDGWTVQGEQNWILNQSNFAGGTPPEILYVGIFPTTGIQRLITKPVNTLGSTSLELVFKHLIATFGNGFYLGIQTSSNVTIWHDVITYQANDVPPTTEFLTISTPDVGSSTFRLAFIFEGNVFDLNAWVIDDVILNEIAAAPHGYLIGNVTLNGDNGSLEEVLIYAGSAVSNPDSDGFYILPLESGIYDVTASLPGYLSDTAFNVNIEENWETYTQDFTLEELTNDYPPQNLIVATFENNIALNWDIPGTLTGNPESQIVSKNDKNSKNTDQRSSNNTKSGETRTDRFLLGYNIYRNEQFLSEISDITTTSYTDVDLDEGEYSYYLTAVYEEGESEPSNTETVFLVLAPPLDFTANFINPNVLLQWTSPGWSILDFYRIYRDGELINELNSLWTFDTNPPEGIHEYYATAVYGDYESGPSNTAEVDVTAIEDPTTLPETRLFTNFPNPFSAVRSGRNPETTIDFSLREEAKVTIEIFDIKGRKVKTLLDETRKAGNSQVAWNGKDEFGKKAGAGIYFYKMSTHDYAKTRKMILLR